jgi:hypothetical protein
MPEIPAIAQVLRSATNRPERSRPLLLCDCC